MASNLPPGVSVGDLPGNRAPEPECRECGAYPSVEAMEDGYQLCEEHDTEECRDAQDEWMERKRKEHEAKKRREERDEPIPDDYREKEVEALAERYSEGYNAE